VESSGKAFVEEQWKSIRRKAVQERLWKSGAKAFVEERRKSICGRAAL
jgi:hypothetical protein